MNKKPKNKKPVLISLILIILLGTIVILNQKNPDSNVPGKINTAISKAQQNLLSLQKNDGHWEGEYGFPEKGETSGMTAWYVLFVDYLGGNAQPKKQAINYIVNSQDKKGGWGDATANYGSILALKRYDAKKYAKNIGKAQRYIEEHNQTLDQVASWIKQWYALYGYDNWNEINTFAPSLSSLDEKNSIQWDKLPPWLITHQAALLVFISKNSKQSLNVEEKKLLKKLEKYLQAEQLFDGSWFSFVTNTLQAGSALHALNKKKYKSEIKEAKIFVESLLNKNGVDFFHLPIWDTEIALIALKESNKERNHQISKALNWLKRAKYPLKGWGFTPAVSVNADLDDTGFAMAALANKNDDNRYNKQNIVKYIFSMQNRDGGWATFRKNTGPFYQKKIRKKSTEWFLLDPSVPDITGHILLGLGQSGYRTGDKRIYKAIDYLKRVQHEEGMWLGWWGLTYIYGTSAVLTGLGAVNEDMNKSYVKKAVSWLKSVQNADGGWGEQEQSFNDKQYAGRGSSTSSQTAWAISGLLAAKEDPDSEQIKRGIEYLLKTQKPDGSWEADITANIPYFGVAPYKNSIYANAFPLWALADYKNALMLKVRTD